MRVGGRTYTNQNCWAPAVPSGIATRGPAGSDWASSGTHQMARAVAAAHAHSDAGPMRDRKRHSSGNAR
ncbi:hypothetical protein ACVWXU_003439 [Streptomyces sp. TE33382]